MRRLKHHREILKKILLDDRITGSRRILGELMALWLDADNEADKSFIKEVIRSTWENPSRPKWVADDEAAVKPDAERIESASAQHIRTIFQELAQAKEGRANDTGSATEASAVSSQ